MELDRCYISTTVKLEYYDVLIEFDKSSVVNAIIRISKFLNEYCETKKKLLHIYISLGQRK